MCKVFGCKNEKGQGLFVGEICAPCYEIITEGNPYLSSTNFIHELALENEQLKACLHDVNEFVSTWLLQSNKGE